MNLVGNRRASPAKLAAHLMNVEDNEHVSIHEIRGFVADDLHGAYYEAYAISRGTRCKKYLYSLSLNPPGNEDVPIDVFEATIEKIENKLGFTGQPRTIVFHEKKGRRHAHVVWSRINTATMTAIDPFEDKLKLNEIGRELFLEYGWEMPDGYKRKEDADPFSYSHAEAKQAERSGYDPKELKRFFAECWQRSDSKAAFEQAMREAGFLLARGDRRSHVAVDAKGEVYSIARMVKIKAKEVRARLGGAEELQSIEEALQSFPLETQKKDAPTQADIERETKLLVLEAKRVELVEKHRKARAQLEHLHKTRRIEETKERAARIPKGLKGVWLKVSGNYQKIQRELEVEAKRCDARDQAEYQTLIHAQLQERRVLQAKIDTLKPEAPFLRLDQNQNLVIPPDPEELSVRAKVQKDPARILSVVSRKQENFTRPVIVRALAQYINDPLKLGLAVDTAMRSSELVELNSTPLPVYSTRELLNIKQGLSNAVRDLSRSKGARVSSGIVNSAIAEQSNALQRSIGAPLSDQQEKAIRHCLKPDRISAVVGLAGAGKSTMLSAVREAYQKQGLRVIGAALAGKAADSLESASGIKSRTLTSWKRSWEKGFNQLTKNDVLVIDEAGMIDTRQMKYFIDRVQNAGAKIILVGDPEQLQPINAGTPFKEIADQIGVAHLTEIHRQTQDWQKQASLDFAERRTEKAIDAYELHGNVKQSREYSEAIVELVQDYMNDLKGNGSQVTRLALAYRRKDVFTINQAIRSARQNLGELKDGVLISTSQGPRVFASDDRITFTKPEYSMGIRNGMVGTVKSVTKTKIIIKLDGKDTNNSRCITINPKLYKDIDHGYATTIHKSQGATIDRAYVLGSVLVDRHLTYVAMTRHRNNVMLYGDHTSLQKMRRSGDHEKRDYSSSEKPRHRQHRDHGPTMH